MKIPLTVVSVFLTVTIGSLAGMLLGGAFGYAAASIAPALFISVFQPQLVEPVGAAVVAGAFGGVICGGSLGAFAVAVQAFADWLATPCLDSE